MLKIVLITLTLTLTSVWCQNAYTDLFNSQVQSMQKMSRPLEMVGGSALTAIGIQHEGVLVTLTNGKKHLIHKTKGITGPGGSTVVTDAAYMSSLWKKESTCATMKPGTTVGQLVKIGGTDYGLFFDNCMKAAGKMMQTCAN